MGDFEDIAARGISDVFQVLGRVADYVAGGGSPVKVTVIVRTPDQNAAGAVLMAHRLGGLLEVEISELATQPAEGDKFMVGARVYRVRAARADDLGLRWLIDADVVPA